MRRLSDEACDPQARSWIDSAQGHLDFPLQNLPLGIVRPRASTSPWHLGSAIGAHVLDLAACVEAGLLHSLPDDVQGAVSSPTLAPLLERGTEAIGALRLLVHRLLREDCPVERRARVARCLVDADQCDTALPVVPGQFTDFFASLHHVERVMRVKDATAPLPPAIAYVPLAYHGAVSSLRVSGSDVRRPHGARRGDLGVVFAPTERLDYEAEVGLFVGRRTQGALRAIDDAGACIAGACLLNDWSARDTQAFESQPLGPFASKGFATTLSPWMVTAQALAPFAVEANPRPPSLPDPLPHLVAQGSAFRTWAVDIEVWLTSARMRAVGIEPVRLSRASLRDLLWTPTQLVAHLTSSGYDVRSADLIGTGTVSGPGLDARSALLELTRGGREPLTLPSGETRAYLEDGDEVVLRGSCTAPQAVGIGFGECRGRIVAAATDDL